CVDVAGGRSLARLRVTSGMEFAQRRAATGPRRQKENRRTRNSGRLTPSSCVAYWERSIPISQRFRLHQDSWGRVVHSNRFVFRDIQGRAGQWWWESYLYFKLIFPFFCANRRSSWFSPGSASNSAKNPHPIASFVPALEQASQISFRQRHFCKALAHSGPKNWYREG